MEPALDKATIIRPSYIASVELPPRIGPVNVEDLKADLSDEFSLVSSNLDISQRNSLDSKEHIQVCLRIRPFTATEKENESQDCVSIQDSTNIILKGPKNSMICRLSEKNVGQMVQKFTFSRVFGPETTQEEFFDGTVKQPVQDFLDGHNRLIFTYGVTNAGKTYTFQGTEADIGILPRTMDMLFKSIHGKLYPDMDFKPLRCRDYIRLTKEQVREEIAVKNSILRLMKEVDSQNSINNHSKTSESFEDLEEPLKEPEQPNMSVESYMKFSVWVSFCEIYNECIYDLLLPVSNDKKRRVLRLAQDVKGCSYVKDLQWIQISDSKEAFKLLKLGLKHQSIACTKLNTYSSRSHSIFTVKMLKIEDSEAPNVTRVSELALCDLAGSERCTKTRNEGDRLKESGNINTSLLILGKCINALKNSQQSKLQLHIPFRESKLTHFLQGFFSGKGKVYMIVNISQCAAAYDETLNVLKFSAIAQKICVLDTSNAPQQQPFVQKSAREVSLINNADTKMQVARKRATILWDRSLEDVIEDDDDLTVDNNETHEEHDVAKEMPNEEEEHVVAKEMPNEEEENKVIIGKEVYQRLLNIIEHLKSKLINERKDKLLLELKIREEVTQEFTQYFAQRETDFRQCLSHERELLEKASEQRLEIYKDLVNECAKNLDEEQEIKDSHCNDSAGMLEGGNNVAPENCIDLEGIINFLQDDVTDIKKQAEEAHRYIVSLEDPQEAIAWLEQKLGKVTVELTKTKEELTQRTKEIEMQVINLSESAQQLEEATEKMTTQNKRIQELIHIVEQKDDVISRLQDLISHLETTVKDYDNTVTTIKRQMAKENSNGKIEGTQSSESVNHVLDVGRKRCFESKPTQEEEPPTKKGSIRSACKSDAIEQKKIEEMQQNILEKEAEILALQERSESLDCQLAILKEELTNEKREKEGFNRQVANLCLELSSSKERASGLSEELQQCQASYGKIASELDTQKVINKEQEEKIKQLTTEVEASSQNIIAKVSQIKAMQTKIDELHKLDLESSTIDVNLVTLKDFLEDSQKDKAGKIQMHSLNTQCQTSNIADVGRESFFHSGIEGIWKECKQIIKASSEKSNQIQELLQQVENLQKSISEVESENNQLKIQLDDLTNQGNLSIKEKENLINQLQEQLQEKICESEKRVTEDRSAITQLEKQSASHKGKIKELECLLEAYRAKDDNAARLEQILKEKESIILKMEMDIKDLEKKYMNSEIKIKELNDQETKLKEAVIQLKNNLKTIEHSLQEKEREEEKSKKVTERLNKELCESSAFIQRLEMDCQRKDEEYTDLKEKLADAKKQIEQVQKEVCTMRSEEKLLRSKVNEHEKTKKQFAEELDMKQRTIQQLKKELLGNKQIEEISKQYQNAYKDLRAKEKIIEDMRLTLEEQEQTQLEQDQVLETKLEETEKLASELEEWKQKYKELEKSNSECQQKINKHEDKNIDAVSGELISLQERLKETEEKYRTDRKKWVEEKMGLITQAKEAENHRNREMRKFAEDRERHVKQQTEVEKLTAQLAEKDNDLQKWRKERDQLVTALEVQLSALVSSNIQKDKEIEELKHTTLAGSGKDYGTAIEELRRQMAEKDDTIKKLKQLSCHENPKTLKLTALPEGQNKVNEYLHSKQFKEKQRENNPIAGQSIPINCNEVKDNLLSQCSSSVSSLDETEDHSDTVLDSSEVSTENGKGSRFPKSEMEIQFTPLHPNKMEVKHQGSALPVTVKMPKTRRKRKSNELDEDLVKSENKKNATPTAADSSPIKSNSAKINKKKMMATTQSFRKEYPLRKQVSTSSTKSTQKKDGTLQKLGDFFQSSPTIIHSKAKKLIATISSPKSTEVETHKAKEQKPKRTKRKLYSTDISFPLDIPGDVIMDQKEKESDHLIIKRRLRSKTAR
ncbi:kinesin-like protein KIF20B isoform X2 [Dermochelys coriacea]|uniref:kinesin-like protein KIF20B isoform X2 n=1 Tax=Dermochelys coriacea TaxID=27794 RepID=UPI0018E82BB0|nr:kinesin-like protein KIF20B isoform X2 [Dermochelys coriacea]